MKCANDCGRDQRPNSNFCEDCWEDVLERLAANTARANRERSRIPAWAIVLVLMLSIWTLAVLLVLLLRSWLS